MLILVDQHNVNEDEYINKDSEETPSLTMSLIMRKIFTKNLIFMRKENVSKYKVRNKFDAEARG